MIGIFLAAFNGERYIEAQIQSIINQTYSNWILFIQDDCSTDKTFEISNKYANLFPKKIILSRRKYSSGSAKANFFSMLGLLKCEYYMTCDQDDIWLEKKIELTLDKMVELENKYNSETPLLVHSDLKIVDSKLKVISESMFKYQKLNYNKNSLNYLLIQNMITGCTMMCNNALLKLLREKIPKNAIEHDWWTGLVASTFGKIGFLNTPTVLYRQHSSNSVGASNMNDLKVIIKMLLKNNKIKKSILNTYVQAEELLFLYGGIIPKHKNELITMFISMRKIKKLAKLGVCFKFNFWKNGIIGKIGQILFI